MTNEERLQQAQKIESHQRRLAIFCCSTAGIVILSLCAFFFISTSASQDSSGNKTPGGLPTAEASVPEDTSSSSSGSGTGTPETSSVSENPGQSSETSPVLSESSLVNSEPESSASSEESSKSSEESSEGESSVENSSEESQEPLPDGFEIRTMTEEEMHQGKLILVNKEYAYTFPDVKMDDLADYLNGTFSLASDGILMESEAAAHYANMLENYFYATGDGNLLVLNGYRSEEEADTLYSQQVEKNGSSYADRYNMTAGHSEHHSGYASDLGYALTDNFISAETTDNYQWFVDNAHLYGFIIRYPEGKEDITGIAYESWHFRYVGVAAATDMYKSGMCLEEWEEYIKGFSVTSPHTFSQNGFTYTRYYAKGLEVPVPSDTEYEISGNNVDGFLVTITTRE